MTAIMLCDTNETHVTGIRIRYSVQVQASIPVYPLLMDVQARPKHESTESTAVLHVSCGACAGVS